MKEHPPAAPGPALPDCLRHVVSAPPFALLRDRIERIERAGVTVALGGSGLLAALQLTDHVRDWDLTTDAPLEQVTAALAGEPYRASGGDHLHADHKLALSDGQVEVIVGFAFHTPAGVVRIATIVSARPDGLPLGSPEGWAVAYALLGRPAKSKALLAYLATHGVEPGAQARLLDEPLPSELAGKLAALPTSRVM